MKSLTYLFAVLLIGTSVAAHATQVVSFASGKATAPLPDGFSISTSGDGLTATFGEQSDHTVELSLVGIIPDPDGTHAQALAFINQQGEKKGARVSRRDDRAMFGEAGSEQQRDGKVFKSMHVQVGVGNCVFVMTLTAPVPMSRDFEAFVDGPMIDLLNGVTCSAP